MAFVHDMFESDMKLARKLLADNDLKEFETQLVHLINSAWMRGCAAALTTAITQRNGGVEGMWYALTMDALKKELEPIERGEKTAKEMAIAMDAEHARRDREAMAANALAELDMSGEKVN